MENENVQNPMPQESKGMSIASLVLGIVSVVLFCYTYISIPCAILAIIFGILGKKKGGKGMAKAGLILGIIAMALIVFIWILAAAGFAAMGSMLNDLSYELNNIQY